MIYDVLAHLPDGQDSYKATQMSVEEALKDIGCGHGALYALNVHPEERNIFMIYWASNECDNCNCVWEEYLGIGMLDGSLLFNFGYGDMVRILKDWCADPDMRVYFIMGVVEDLIEVLFNAYK